ncbi:MAG TPA: D-aminoacyl-tRNA deacylase [Candidatus Kapabacteria bacterium]|nr:D-aminoacyl-tRNA deacylase [Candidatus Kapabacteria bacterium]
MRALIQRVIHGSVTIDGERIAEISRGMVILLGVKKDDTSEAAEYLARRTAALRIFDDPDGVMNFDIGQAGGEALVVSQFTLYADTRKGNRPSYIDAAPPEEAGPLYNSYVEHLRALIGNDNVRTGVFRAMMEVEIANDGPVTIMLESK